MKPRKKEENKNKLATAESFLKIMLPKPQTRNYLKKIRKKPLPFCRGLFCSSTWSTRVQGALSHFPPLPNWPRNALLLVKAQLRGCSCEYCTSISLKLQSLRAAATAHGLISHCISTERDAVLLLLLLRSPAMSLGFTIFG